MDSNLADRQIHFSRGVGPQRARLLARIGITTIRDSLYYLPFRYEDRANLKQLCDLTHGQQETVRGKIISAVLRSPRGKRFSIFEMLVNDGTGLLRAKWFNQPFIKKVFSVGDEVVLHGMVKTGAYSSSYPEIDNPEYEIVNGSNDAFLHTQRIVPVYRITEGISQKQFRKLMFGIVHDHASEIPDPIPLEIREKYHFPPLQRSLMQVHFPDESDSIESLNSRTSDYHRRLAFDELFLFGVGVSLRRKNKMSERGLAFDCPGSLQKALFRGLTFRLTNAQERAVLDILRDMKSPHPMNRLLQGDVGCGKTIVALAAMLNAVECGYQAALMAPTEILAEQHYGLISEMVRHLGVKTGLLVSSMRERRADLIASGEIQIIIGTHALLQEGVIFDKLGLVVIDEQHRFGVMQRTMLRKKGVNPDVLVMTATPIPRSLALTLYGDLDYSIIDELPPQRQPVSTKVLDASKKEEIYNLLENEISGGRQAYVVYPAIEESENSSLKSAVQGRDAFQSIFPGFRIELLHGKMNILDRARIVDLFKNGEIDILVSTTVVEVGVDVPNATVMLIIHAERFGLAQLHQLRGRVGRGGERAYCLLIVYEPCSEDARRRLDILVESTDGFRIAEEDLAIRGPGEFFGLRQAGMPDFKVADIIRDVKVLETAGKEAVRLVGRSPELREFPELRRALGAFWQDKADFFMTG